MKMTITGQIDGKSVPITIPIEKVIEAFWPYATKPSALSVSTELDADGISANFMLGQETKDSYPGIWLTSKNSNTGRAGFWFCLELPNETNDMVKGYLYAGDDESSFSTSPVCLQSPGRSVPVPRKLTISSAQAWNALYAANRAGTSLFNSAD